MISLAPQNPLVGQLFDEWLKSFLARQRRKTHFESAAVILSEMRQHNIRQGGKMGIMAVIHHIGELSQCINGSRLRRWHARSREKLPALIVESSPRMTNSIQVSVQRGMSPSKFSKELAYLHCCVVFYGRIIFNTSFCHKPRSRGLGKVTSIFILLSNETIKEWKGFDRAKLSE